MQSVPITNKVVCSNPIHGKVYSMQHYEIKFVSDLRRSVVFSGFRHDITEILLKVALNTINQPKPPKIHRGLSFYRIIRDKVSVRWKLMAVSSFRL